MYCGRKSSDVPDVVRSSTHKLLFYYRPTFRIKLHNTNEDSVNIARLSEITMITIHTTNTTYTRAPPFGSATVTQHNDCIIITLLHPLVVLQQLHSMISCLCSCIIVFLNYSYLILTCSLFHLIYLAS